MEIETSLTPEDSTITTYNLQNSHFFFSQLFPASFYIQWILYNCKKNQVSMYNTRQQNGNCGGKGN